MNKMEQARQIALTEDVSTPPNSVVLYSISYQPTDENKKSALQYMQQHSETYMIDHTPCGKKLLALGLETGNNHPPAELMEIWAIASKRFILAASGNMTAFVDNADPRSTFVSVELPLILQNERIQTINHMDKFEFAQRYLNTAQSKN